MNEQVISVMPKGVEMPRHANAYDPSAPEPLGLRFTYPGGSRPLEGYTIKRGVGQGGFGEIYYAISDAGKEVALKLIRRNLDVELRGIRQCLNLKHPNLLAIFDIRQDTAGDTWVVMEYIGGGSLEDLLDAAPDGLPRDEALAWFHGVATAVAYLHDHGIVHRDLKPGNIFSDEGVVKVGDYGLSKFISCSRRSGHTESVGTVHYMAPEVANGRYGKELDVYALGILLYELLTGRVPFEGESVGEVLMKHLTAKPDLSALAEPYRGVVAKALEKDPNRRFASAGEMLADLPGPAQAPPGGARVGSGSDNAASGARTGTAAPKPTVVLAEPVDEEPVLRAVLDGWRQLRTAWREAPLATPLKLILLLVGLFVVLAMAELWIPLLILSLFAYGIYRVIRAVVRPAVRAVDARRAAAQPGPKPPESPRAEHRAARHESHRRRWHRRQTPPKEAAAALVAKPPRQRLTELVGSMLAAALASMAMCVVMVLLSSYQGTTTRPEQAAWLALVSILGGWAVLVPAKFWEGNPGEPMLRRFVMMVVGLAVGAVAFGIADGLMVSLPPGSEYPKPPDYQLPPSFFAGDGRPLLMAHMACFGTLFLVLRWWRQADPLRSSRLSLWTLAVSGIVAAVVAGVWHFPQPWLLMVAGSISVAVQLSAPWEGRQAEAA